MSLLNSLLVNSLKSSITGTSVYTTSQTIDDDELLTTIVSSATTATATSDINFNINMTNECISYLETMPTQELTNGLDLLNQKEEMLKLEQQNDNKLVKTLKKF